MRNGIFSCKVAVWFKMGCATCIANLAPLPRQARVGGIDVSVGVGRKLPAFGSDPLCLSAENKYIPGTPQGFAHGIPVFLMKAGHFA